MAANSGASMLPDVVAKGLQTFPVTHRIYTASTAAISEIPFWKAPKNCEVLSAVYVASTASAPSSGSNYQTLTITKYDGAGGAGATIASGTISNGTPTAANVALSLGSITNGITAAGSIFSFKTALTGTATVPTGFIELTLALVP